MSNLLNNNQAILKNLKKGEIILFDSFSKSKDYIALIENLIFSGISKIAGQDSADEIKSIGLDNLHKVFPVDYKPFLDNFIAKNIRKISLDFSVEFSDEVLNLKDDEYYIYDNVEVRINYPINEAINSTLSFSDYTKLDLNNYKNVDQEIDKIKKHNNNLKMAASFNERPQHKEKEKYFDKIPYAARRSAPHIDIWYGHPIESLNLWFGVAGCTKENSVFFYPDAFGSKLKYIDGRIAPIDNYNFSKPYCPEIPKGHTLIFNPMNLHSTHIGTANKTRISLVGRINTQYPTFSKTFVNGIYEAEPSIWYNSSDIRNKKYDNSFEINRGDNVGKVGDLLEEQSSINIVKKIYFDKKLDAGKEYYVDEKKQLIDENKFQLVFTNTEILVVRKENNFYAIGSKCPHSDVELNQGFIEDENIICPHHLLKINYITGDTSCTKLKVKTYKIKENNSKIFLHT